MHRFGQEQQRLFHGLLNGAAVEPFRLAVDGAHGRARRGGKKFRGGHAGFEVKKRHLSVKEIFLSLVQRVGNIWIVEIGEGKNRLAVVREAAVQRNPAVHTDGGGGACHKGAHSARLIRGSHTDGDRMA